MKLKLGTYIFFSMLLLACGGEPQESNVISMEEFIGETGEESVVEEVVIDTAEVIGTEIIDQFVSNQLEAFDTAIHSEYHPLDRFTFNQRQKIRFKSKTDVPYGDDTMVTPRAEMFYYTFSDTTKTKNAFYNWLDCFGGECDMIKLNEDFGAIKMPPKFVIVYDTVIVVMDYRCEDQSFDWNPLEDSVVSQFGKNYNYRMHIGCGGPLKWK